MYKISDKNVQSYQTNNLQKLLISIVIDHLYKTLVINVIIVI